MSTERPAPRAPARSHPVRLIPAGQRHGVAPDAARRERQRGAVLIEFAFCVPILFALVFGIMDFGASYNNDISLREGARQALRQLLTDTTPAASGGTWSCPITSPSPPTVGTDAYSMVCYTKAQINLVQADTRVKIFFTAPYTAGNPVKICVQYPTSSLTGAYTVLHGKDLTTQVESLIETSQPTFTAPFAETPITSWPASCSTL